MPTQIPQMIERPAQGSVANQQTDEEKLSRLATGIFFFGIFVVLVKTFLQKLSWMVFVQDDFLYYLKVAQNIALGHGSTFNQIVPTNGYQPLLLLLLIPLNSITQSSTAIAWFLAGITFIAAVVTFLLAGVLIRRSGVRPWTVFVLAALTTLYSVTLFFYGMEVTLTVPIMLGVMCLLGRIEWLKQSGLHSFLLGLLLSAMVLSRIDTLIFGGLVLAGILLTPQLRRLIEPRLLGGVALGLIPLVIYFLLNRRLFGSWLPISGMAKELRFTHVPSLEPWRVFFHPISAAFTVILFVALSMFPAVARRLNAMERVFYPAVILFPFVYYTILSCISDWPLWGWYMYPIRTAICISFSIFCLYPPVAKLLQRPAVLVLLGLFVFVWLGKLHWTVQQVDIQAASLDIQQFAKTHPGIYAMGDRAGRVAYLIPDPIIQTEGLMMDREYLRYVERETPLRDTLAHYNVRYYVATAYQPFTECFEASEPAKAGPSSAHMRGTFCEPAVATYLHDGVETLIFDLQRSN